MYLGIDLTSGEHKRSACAVLDSAGKLIDIAKIGSNAEILSRAERGRPHIVAIDAPLSYPRGMNCLEEPCLCGGCASGPWALREAERRLFQERISCYPTTKRTFVKPMVYRGIELAAAFRVIGCQVIEVFPYASKVRLFGRPIPKKGTLEGRHWLRNKLNELIPGLSEYGPLNHDQLDALVASFTAYLYGRGYGEELGERDEGIIIVPGNNYVRLVAARAPC